MVTFLLTALSSFLMLQILEEYWLNLLSFRFVCSKLHAIVNANIKINDLFYPIVCGLKAIFSCINGSKFLPFLILLVFFFCWNFFLRIKYHPQNPQNLNPAKAFDQSWLFPPASCWTTTVFSPDQNSNVESNVIAYKIWTSWYPFGNSYVR